MNGEGCLTEVIVNFLTGPLRPLPLLVGFLFGLYTTKSGNTRSEEALAFFPLLGHGHGWGKQTAHWGIVCRPGVSGQVTIVCFCQRVQRGDSGVQEHQLHSLGCGWPGQDSASLETLLPEHPR